MLRVSLCCLGWVVCTFNRFYPSYLFCVCAICRINIIRCEIVAFSRLFVCMPAVVFFCPSLFFAFEFYGMLLLALWPRFMVQPSASRWPLAVVLYGSALYAVWFYDFIIAAVLASGESCPIAPALNARDKDDVIQQRVEWWYSTVHVRNVCLFFFH